MACLLRRWATPSDARGVCEARVRATSPRACFSRWAQRAVTAWTGSISFSLRPCLLTAVDSCGARRRLPCRRGGKPCVGQASAGGLPAGRQAIPLTPSHSANACPAMRTGPLLRPSSPRTASKCMPCAALHGCRYFLFYSVCFRMRHGFSLLLPHAAARKSPARIRITGGAFYALCCRYKNCESWPA